MNKYTIAEQKKLISPKKSAGAVKFILEMIFVLIVFTYIMIV